MWRQHNFRQTASHAAAAPAGNRCIQAGINTSAGRVRKNCQPAFRGSYKLQDFPPLQQQSAAKRGETVHSVRPNEPSPRSTDAPNAHSALQRGSHAHKIAPAAPRNCICAHLAFTTNPKKAAPQGWRLASRDPEQRSAPTPLIAGVEYLPAVLKFKPICKGVNWLCEQSTRPETTATKSQHEREI